MTAGDVRVLLVDDSPTVRAVLHRILRKTPDLSVVGEAEDGEDGVRLARELEPDVILMDIVMPKLDGFEATRRIMQETPCAVMVFSTEAIVEGHRVFEAYNLGARDVIAKPASPQAWIQFSEVLPERIRQVVQGFRDRHSVGTTSAAPRPSEGDWAQRLLPLRYVAIGASTGGPEALREFLRIMAPGPPMAILVVQHIAKEFEQGLIEWLHADVRIRIRMATQGEKPQPGMVYLAPQGSHLRLEAGGCLRLDDETPAIRGHRPAADVLLSSCAASAGRQAAGVLLSGMGSDGVEGLKALREAGGLTLVQNQASSVVFGMPQAALRAKAAERALCPTDLAKYLLKSCRTGETS